MSKEFKSINVDGMSCNHCVNAVKSAVQALNGIIMVEVDLAGKKVIVEYEDEKLSLETIKGTIEDQGYSVK